MLDVGPCNGPIAKFIGLMRQNEDFRAPSSLFQNRAGFIGRVKQGYGGTRHDGRNRVFIDELGMAIPTQQKAKIVKPRDDALKLHAVYKEDRQRNFGLPDMV
ncbi:MAG: hypothetical protein RLZ07_1271 [Pseudomonadota bacterium]